MRKYEYQLIIEESVDEFFENLAGTGCEELTEFLEGLLDENFNMDKVVLRLVHYTNSAIN
jgi:hypothetical protein